MEAKFKIGDTVVIVNHAKKELIGERALAQEVHPYRRPKEPIYEYILFKNGKRLCLAVEDELEKIRSTSRTKDRIVIIGPKGCGKSRLSKLMTSASGLKSAEVPYCAWSCVRKVLRAHIKEELGVVVVDEAGCKNANLAHTILRNTIKNNIELIIFIMQERPEWLTIEFCNKNKVQIIEMTERLATRIN